MTTLTQNQLNQRENEGLLEVMWTFGTNNQYVEVRLLNGTRTTYQLEN